jgi:hypothetical protein
MKIEKREPGFDWLLITRKKRSHWPIAPRLSLNHDFLFFILLETYFDLKYFLVYSKNIPLPLSHDENDKNEEKKKIYMRTI